MIDCFAVHYFYCLTECLYGVCLQDKLENVQEIHSYRSTDDIDVRHVDMVLLSTYTIADVCVILSLDETV